jgi:hypothetical protein
VNKNKKRNGLRPLIKTLKGILDNVPRAIEKHPIKKIV